MTQGTEEQGDIFGFHILLLYCSTVLLFFCSSVQFV